MYWFLVLRDRGEQGSQNPVLFGELLTYWAQNRPAAAACGGEWALLALALCASQLLCLLLLHLLHLLRLLRLLRLLQLLLRGGLHLLLQCLHSFLLLFPSVACFLCKFPCSSPPSDSKIRSNNSRHAVMP